MIPLLAFTNEEISKKDCSERSLHVDESKGGEGGLQQMFDERCDFHLVGVLEGVLVYLYRHCGVLVFRCIHLIN